MNSNEEVVYRPPAEANSLLLQVTIGCSFNKCTFCTMYEDKKYDVRKLEDIYDEIEVMSTLYPDTKRVFLCDGDSLNLDTIHLVKILIHLNKFFLKLKRVATYASSFNLLKKSKKELLILKHFKLSLFYYGLESGDELVLKSINKYIKTEQIINDLNKVSECNIKISLMIILGIAGKKRSLEHIKNSALLINQVKVNYLSTLQLGLADSKDRKFRKSYEKYIGEFVFLNQEEMLKEQAYFISLLKPSKALIFRSNHSSNILALAGVLPKDKKKLISEIKLILIKYDLKFISKSFE